MRRTPVLALAAACALAGCGKGGGDDTALRRALADVRDAPSTRAFVAFGDTKALKRLAGAPDRSPPTPPRLDPRWSGVLASGFGVLQAGLGEPGAVDPLSADRALTAGLGADAVRLDGAGVTRGTGGRLLRVRRTRGDAVVFARSPAAADLLLGGDGPSLADAKSFAALAACLGDVVAVEVYGRLPSRQPNTVVALGVRRPGGDDDPVREVLCAVGRDDAGADAEVAALRKGFAPDAAYADAPIRDAVSDTEIGRADASGLPVARAVLTLRQGRPAGFLSQRLRTFDVPGLFDRR